MSAFDHPESTNTKSPVSSGSVGGSSYKNKEIIRCVIALDEGNEDWTVHYSPSFDLAEAIEKAEGLNVFMDGLIDPEDEENKLPYDKEKIPWLLVTPDEIPTTVNKYRQVALCAFHATDTFMKHWTMGSLDSDDQDWYKMHHLVTEDGLPQQHTFTVIQQLVEPYGLGIDRICVPRNARRFNEYVPFIEALGSNPFFRMDGHTTNEEALEKIFSDPNMKKTPKAKKEEMRQKFLAEWRFECRDKPFSGAMLMRQFSTSSVGHNGAATYIGPRAKTAPDGWQMAIKLNRLSSIKYIVPPELTEYKEFEGVVRFDFYKIKDKTGKTLREIGEDIRKSKYASSGYNANRSWDKPSEIKPPEAPKLLAAHLPSTSSAQSSDEDDKESKSFSHWDDDGGIGFYLGGGIGSKKDDSPTQTSKFSYPRFCETCHRDPGLFFQAGVRHCQTCNMKLEKNYICKDNETPDHREFDDKVSATMKEKWSENNVPQDERLVSPADLSDEEVLGLFVQGKLGGSKL